MLAAYRFVSQARHIGKVVMTIPMVGASQVGGGAVVVTGGTGAGQFGSSYPFGRRHRVANLD